MSRASVLQLNADFLPMLVTRWERAVELVMTGVAVTEQAVPGRFVHSAGGLVIPWPSVIRLTRMGSVKPRVRFSRPATLARDNWTCAYCGNAPRTREGRPDRRRLSYDHVIPSSRKRADGRVWLPWVGAWRKATGWENGVCACRACNTRKADRTPEEAGLVLRLVPRPPTYTDVLRIMLDRYQPLPVEWAPWVLEKWGLAFRAARVDGVASQVG